MTSETTIPKLALGLRLVLRREEMFAQGRCDAFSFAMEHRGDASDIQAEIETFEDYVTNPPEALRRAMSPNTSVREHANGYIPGLKEALQIVLEGRASAPSNGEASNVGLPEPLADRLNYEQTVSKGRSDAFLFARKCQGHIGVLRAAIVESEEFPSQASGTVKPDLSQRFSRRFYEEGYLSGLKDAVKILLQAEQSQPQAVTRVAEPTSHTYQATPESHPATTDHTKKKASTVKHPPKQSSKTRRQVRRRKQQGTS